MCVGCNAFNDRLNLRSDNDITISKKVTIRQSLFGGCDCNPDELVIYFHRKRSTCIPSRSTLAILDRCSPRKVLPGSTIAPRTCPLTDCAAMAINCRDAPSLVVTSSHALQLPKIANVDDDAAGFLLWNCLIQNFCVALGSASHLFRALHIHGLRMEQPLRRLM